MKVIIAWDGDHIGREVGRASLADDVEGLRRISQNIDRGNEVWRSWVERSDGSMISCSGDQGKAEISAEYLSELPKVRDQYAGCVEATVSVGVGTKLSEADKALMAAKLEGGNKIVLYSEEVEERIAEASKKEKTEGDKLSEEYLTKAQPQAQPQPAANAGAGGGFAGASKPSVPSVASPDVEASEHSQGEAAQQASDDRALPPESTHAAADFEDMFHDLAGKEQEKEQGIPQPQGDPNEQMKLQIVQVLQALKAQAPVLEQVKQSAPDTYAAVMGLAQAVIGMAKQISGTPTHTTVKEIDDGARSQNEFEVPQPPEEDDDKGEKDDTKKSEEQLSPDALKEGVDWELVHGGATEHAKALETVIENLTKDPDHYKNLLKEVESLDKASLSMPGGGVPSHHHVILPVGSHKDPGAKATRDVGKVKVLHPETQKESWIQARAGQIMSQDGHAISSRNPKGK